MWDPSVMLNNYRVGWGGGPWDFSVSPRPFGFGFLGFGAKGLGPGFDNTEPVWNLILNPIRMLSCKRNFFLWSILPPSFAKLLFALQIVNRKKNLISWYNVCEFFFENMIAFEETIPKRYNTWGQEVCNPLPATPTHRKPHPPPTQILKYDFRPQVLYLFGIVSTNATIFGKGRG